MWLETLQNGVTQRVPALVIDAAGQQNRRLLLGRRWRRGQRRDRNERNGDDAQPSVVRFECGHRILPSELLVQERKSRANTRADGSVPATSAPRSAAHTRTIAAI